MRIMYWTPMFWPDIGGIETIAMRLLPELQDRGHQVIALASHTQLELPEESTYKNILVYRYPILNAIAARNLHLQKEIQNKIKHLKRTFQPDLVQISMGPPVAALFHLKTMDSFPSPLLLTVPANLSGFRANRNTLLGALLRIADWVTSDSQTTLNSIQAVYPQVTQKSTAIYNGFQYSALEIHELNFKTPHILCIGRLVPEKGFDIVIGSFKKVIERFPNASLTIVGDGPERLNLEQQVKENDLCDTVSFSGRIDHKDVVTLINSSVMVVIPSHYQDSLPMVSIEAAWLARPIVAAKVGGLPESVIHGKTGLLFEKENQAELRDAMDFLLENSSIAIQFGKAGHLRAQDKFSWPRYVDAYEKLYQTMAM